MKYLIINADDFGLTRGVTDAIIEAHRDGVLTSTTLMVGMPAAAYALERAREYPSLGVGLHLNLTAGRPVLPPEKVPSLVDGQGRFVKDFNRLALRARRSEVRAEWSAQIEAMLALGRKPSHLDSHHNVHALPAFAGIAVELARQYGIGALRVTRPQDLPWGGRNRGVGPLEWVYNWLVRSSAAQIDASGLARPDRMAGYLPDDLALDLDRALTALTGLPDGVTELLAHPGRVDDDLRAISSLRERREVELATLVAPRLRQHLKDEGIKLISFAALQPSEVTLVAPLTGRPLPLASVPDPVFSEGMVGDGAAIEAAPGPDGKATLVAPAAGTITLVHSAGHGVGLTTPEGLELLLHIGLDTVEMGGRGFEPLVQPDQRVRPGQPLVRFDAEAIRQAGHSLVSPIVVTNAESLAKVELASGGDVAGRDLAGGDLAGGDLAGGDVAAGSTPFLRLTVKPV